MAILRLFQSIKEQIISICSQSIENNSNIPSSFAEVNVIFIKKINQDNIKLFRRYLFMNVDAKILIKSKKSNREIFRRVAKIILELQS